MTSSSPSSPSSALWEERWSDENFQSMVNLWNLSTKNQERMHQLRNKLKDIGDHWKNDPHEVVRYLNEYKGNVRKAERMFRHMIKWRQKESMESFLQRHAEPNPLWHQMPISILNTTDKDGDPIFVDRIGAADSWSLLKNFGQKAMTDYIVFTRELHSSRSFWKPYEDQVGHRVKTMTVIVDLEGLNAGHLRPGLLALLQRTARISQDCYSGWVKRIILLRAPSIFKLTWSLVGRFFDKHIQDMITVTTQSDYLDVLQEYIELDNLPPELVPGNAAVGGMGYFSNVSLKGGPLKINGQEEQEESGGSSTLDGGEQEKRKQVQREASITSVAEAQLIYDHQDSEETTTTTTTKDATTTCSSKPPSLEGVEC